MNLNNKLIELKNKLFFNKMNIIGNLSGDENGFIYDSSAGRIYQKEVTWECDEREETKDTFETPEWFRRWATDFQHVQKLESDTVPSWFTNWLNKVNFIPPSTPQSNVMPLWFKEWLYKNPNTSVSNQYTTPIPNLNPPLYPYQNPPPYIHIKILSPYILIQYLIKILHFILHLKLSQIQIQIQLLHHL